MDHATRNSNARPRILFVDDSRLMRFAAGRMLESSFDLVLADDGEAAWRALDADPTIRAVITDINMPRLDGIGLIRKIRASGDAACHSLPILVVTSVEEAASRRRAMEAGANDLVPKPFTPQDLIEPVRGYLARAAAAESRASEALPPARHEQPNVERRRAGLVARTEQALRLHHRHALPLSLLHVRLRNHATIGNRWGGACAESTMRHVERGLAGQVRLEDTIGRSAPDTFTLVLLATPESGARVLCQRLARVLSRMPARFPTRSVDLDLSFAVQAPMGEADAESLLAAGLARLDAPNVVHLAERATA